MQVIFQINFKKIVKVKFETRSNFDANNAVFIGKKMIKIKMNTMDYTLLSSRLHQ